MYIKNGFSRSHKKKADKERDFLEGWKKLNPDLIFPKPEFLYGWQA